MEEALSRNPILIYEQDADGENRYVYYGETARGRLLAIVLTERDNRIRVITAYALDAGQKRDYLERRTRGEWKPMSKKTEQTTPTPKFANGDEEASWWASTEGRRFVERRSAAGTSKKQKGSPLVAGLTRASSVRIALRLAAPDLDKARVIAGRKGIGYQTLLKMLVHEGLRREARRL